MTRKSKSGLPEKPLWRKGFVLCSGIFLKEAVFRPLTTPDKALGLGSAIWGREQAWEKKPPV